MKKKSTLHIKAAVMSHYLEKVKSLKLIDLFNQYFIASDMTILNASQFPYELIRIIVPILPMR